MDARKKRQDIGHFVTIATEVPNGEAETWGEPLHLLRNADVGVDISASGWQGARRDSGSAATSITVQPVLAATRG